MRTRVEKTDDPQMYLIVFEDKYPVFPIESVSYDDPESARRQGFYAIDDLFKNQKVANVQAAQVDSIDMFAVTLKDGESWGDPEAKGSEAYTVKLYIDKYLDKGDAIYQNPQEATVPTQDEVDLFITEQTAISGTVFSLMKEDEGGLIAKIDPNTRSLNVLFNGNCAHACKKGSPITSKRALGLAFKRLSPGLRLNFLN